jgi:hypothetical protein
VLRDGPWTNQPRLIDRTTIRRPTPEAFRPSITTPTVEVLPLVKNLKGEFRPGWCTYSDALDSPETEVLCGGINHKTPTAAAIWRQGHLLHFGFDLSPDEMTETGQALLINAIAYIARFTEDRPITEAPERAVLRVGPDRITKLKAADKGYVDWYFTQSVRLAGKVEDWPAFQVWYRQHRDYLRADPEQRGSLILDEDAEQLGVPPGRPEFFPAMIAALKKGGPQGKTAARLLKCYAPSGPKEPTVQVWQSWWEENKSYLFFSEAGWYRWYIDPLAKKRGVPAAKLRGPQRATTSGS